MVLLHTVSQAIEGLLKGTVATKGMGMQMAHFIYTGFRPASCLMMENNA